MAGAKLHERRSKTSGMVHFSCAALLTKQCHIKDMLDGVNANHLTFRRYGLKNDHHYTIIAFIIMSLSSLIIPFNISIFVNILLLTVNLQCPTYIILLLFYYWY